MRNRVRGLVVATIAIGALLVPRWVEAGTIFVGMFTSVVPGPSDPPFVPVYSGLGDDTLKWGQPSRAPGGRQSVVVYTGRSFIDDAEIYSGDPFPIGFLTFVNGAIIAGTSIEGGQMGFLSISDDSALNDGFIGARFITESTPNNSTPLLNADYFFFLESSRNDLFPDFFNVLEGGQASANVYAQMADGVTGASASALGLFGPASGVTFNIVGFGDLEGDGFLTFEPINASIPEPSTIVLLGIGLGAAATRFRRHV